jgi:uncharacterized RDD family membrane protein YckC
MAKLKAAKPTQGAPHLPYASLSIRLVAFILDLVVLLSFLTVFVAAALLYLLFRSNFGEGELSSADDRTFIAIILSFLIFVPVYFVFLLAWRGQTVGKMAVRIKVVRRDGGRVGLGQAFLRWLGYPASALPLGLGFLMALFNGERRALHDLLAGTAVVDLT